MLLFIPKKIKFNKAFSGKKLVKTTIIKKKNLNFANICLIIEQSGFITNFQIESVRRFLRRFLKKKIQLFFRILISKTITKKPKGVKLGRGKGNISY